MPITPRQALLRRILGGFVAAVFWLVVWHLVASWINTHALVVGPIPAAQRLVELVQEPSFLGSVLQTVSNIVAGFVLAMGLGIVMAFLAYFIPAVAVLLTPAVRFMRVVPVASLTILILMIMSSQHLPIVVAFLMVFPLVYLNVWEGLDNTDSQLREMSDVFGVPMHKKLRFLYLPATRPYVVAAYATGFGYAWKSAVTAEVISSATRSIGANISDAKTYLDMPSLFAWTAVIIVLATVTEKIALALIRTQPQTPVRALVRT